MLPTPPLTETADRYLRAGDLPRAEQACREVLQAHPEHAAALALLSIIQYRLGRHDQALACLQHALRIEPSNPAIHRGLGAVYSALRRVGEAVAHFREALRLQPDHAEAHNNFGALLAEQGAHAEAVAHFREALRLQPDLAGAHNNLGIALSERERFAEAEAHYREALRLQPDFANAHSNLGIALAEQGRPAEAEWHYREAIRLRPDYPAAHLNLAELFLQLGRPEEAVASCLKALRLDPRATRAYAPLGELADHGFYRFSDEQLRGIDSLLAAGGLPGEDAHRLHFTLARLADRQGDYDRAFAHYTQANEWKAQALRQKGRAFDPDRHRRSFDDLIAAVDRSFVERVRALGVDTELPVFVVGMPRSGTTLVEQILSSHPHVVGAGELRDLGEILSPPADGGGGTYVGRLAALDRPTARAWAERYLGRLSGLGGEASRVIDKMPGNYVHLGAIAALFPQARVIHCRRDPRDTCLSCYFQDFAWVNYTCSLEHLGFYYRQYERLMRHWQQTLPLRCYELSYEALVADPERVSRELVSFCGLDWNDRCLAFHEHTRPVKTASRLQVRRPVYTSSLGRWKRYAKHLVPLEQALHLADTAALDSVFAAF